jgi:hypothetical protein
VPSDLLAEGLGKLGVVEESKAPGAQMSAHRLGMADLGESPRDHHPVKAGKNPEDLLRMTLDQRSIHGLTSWNRDLRPHPPYRSSTKITLFGSGYAGLGKRAR